jgi:hypothetical protein
MNVYSFVVSTALHQGVADFAKTTQSLIDTLTEQTKILATLPAADPNVTALTNLGNTFISELQQLLEDLKTLDPDVVAEQLKYSTQDVDKFKTDVQNLLAKYPSSLLSSFL